METKPPCPFSPAGRFEERRRDAEQQRALERMEAHKMETPPMTTAETREMLERAWLEVHHAGYEPENERDTCRKCDRFRRLLDAEAYLDAAVMLLPEGCEWDLSTLYGIARVGINLNHGPDDGPSYGEHLGGDPALALLAAIQAAREPDNAQ